METLNSNNVENQDPDYLMLFHSDLNRQNVFENNARTNTSKKISKIIEAEFLNEINNKKTEIYKIYKNLNKACKMLHYLRFAIVTDFYNQESACLNDSQIVKQTRLHPALKPPIKSCFTNTIYINNCFQELNGNNKRKRNINQEIREPKNKYIKDDSSKNIIEMASLFGISSKTKRRIIVGNISKWIPSDFREDNATHKWTVYIRDSQKCDLGKFVSKVRFFLHPSYKPNDVIELTSPPFHLSRHGWGEFPVRVQLHFTNSFDKPVDIIHHLKLDRTFTGLQTIGSETIVDLWITMKDTSVELNINENTNSDVNLISKKSEKMNAPINCYFIHDHDYIGENSILKNRICSHLKEFEENENQKLQKIQKNVSASKCTTSNIDVENNENLIINLSENHNALDKEESDEEILDDTKHNKFENFLERNQNNSESIYNASILLNNFEGNKKILFKSDNVMNSIENFKILKSLIEHVEPNNLFSVLKLITHRMPLITKKSTDPYYKILHPYAAENYQVFSNYPKGKRRSLERYRAISVLNVIKNLKYNNDCNVNEIIIWARRYCYTPFINLKEIYKTCKLIQLGNSANSIKKYKYSSTISEQLNKWLLQCQKIKPNIISYDVDDNEPIDVVNIPLKISNSLCTYAISKEKNNSFISIEYPKTHNGLNEFVCKCAQKLGIKFTNEEIIPGVLNNTASILLSKAVECLIDDLIRLAFSSALDKCESQECSILIKPDDVRMALLKKEEFEIFTNSGLGSEG